MCVPGIFLLFIFLMAAYGIISSIIAEEKRAREIEADRLVSVLKNGKTQENRRGFF